MKPRAGQARVGLGEQEQHPPPGEQNKKRRVDRNEEEDPHQDRHPEPLTQQQFARKGFLEALRCSPYVDVEQGAAVLRHRGLPGRELGHDLMHGIMDLLGSLV